MSSKLLVKVRQSAFAKRTVFYAILVVCTGLTHQALAATGRLYISPASSTVGSGSEVAVQIRIDPGTDINGVAASIGYDASKLQFVSLSDSGTAFPEILAENDSTNPITTTRSAGASSVSADALIVTLRFKALAGSGSTTITLEGNAARGLETTNPSTHGATVQFTTPATTPGTPPITPRQPPVTSPTTPTSPGQSQGPGNSPTQPNTTESPNAPQQQDRPIPVTNTPTSKQPGWRTWLLLATGILILAAGIVAYLLWRQRNMPPTSSGAVINTPPSVRTPEQARTDELLRNIPGVKNPGPGHIVTPNPPKETP